jgi:hypothetical protein
MSVGFTGEHSDWALEEEEEKACPGRPVEWQGEREVWARCCVSLRSGADKGKEMEGIFPAVTLSDRPGTVHVEFAGGFTALPAAHEVFWSAAEALSAGVATGLRVRGLFSICSTDGWGRWEVCDQPDDPHSECSGRPAPRALMPSLVAGRGCADPRDLRRGQRPATQSPACPTSRRQHPPRV